MALVLRTNLDPASVAGAVRSAIRAVIPDFVPAPRTMVSGAAESVARQKIPDGDSRVFRGAGAVSVGRGSESDWCSASGLHDLPNCYRPCIDVLRGFDAASVEVSPSAASV